MAPAPRPGDIHVCCCDSATLDDAALAAAAALLSADERARAARLVSPTHRRDFTAAHALLRRMLSSHHALAPEAWTFTTWPDGKPCLTGDLAAASGLRFNLTHTEGLVACAVTREAEVGIDLEAIDRRTSQRASPLRLARRFFAEQEAEELAHLPEEAQQTRFVEVWTLKEAAVKALGTGLRLPLHDCLFLDDGPDRLRFAQADGWSTGRWHFALLAPTPRHRLAVALLSPPAVNAAPQVRAWRQGLAAGQAIRPEADTVPEVMHVGPGPTAPGGTARG